MVQAPVNPFGQYTPGQLNTMATAQAMGYIQPYVPGAAASAGQSVTLWPEQFQQQMEYNWAVFDRDTAHMSQQEKEETRQFDLNLEKSMDAAKMQYDAAIRTAQIAASSNRSDAASRIEVAKIQADAAVKAANIAAAAAKFDAKTRLQIARETLAVEKSRIFAEELNRPSQAWGQSAFARGWEPAAAKALEVKPPGFLGGDTGGAPALPTTPQTLPGAEAAAYGRGWAPAAAQTLGTQAVVGEQGAELATATPQGTVITPLGQDWRSRYGRIPRAAEGGILQDQTYRSPYEERRRQRMEQWQQHTNQPAPPPTPEVPTAPPTPPVMPLDTLFQQMQQPNQAAFGEWTGPMNKPEVGLNTNVRPPWQYNLNEWNNLSYNDKALLAGTWRMLNMIQGESEAEVLALAEEAMRRSAWTGGGQPQVAYGAW